MQKSFPVKSVFLAAAFDAVVNRPITRYGYADGPKLCRLPPISAKKVAKQTVTHQNAQTFVRDGYWEWDVHPLAAGPIKFRRRQKSFRFLTVRNFRPASAGEPNYSHE
jgi:hypothetical protein